MKKITILILLIGLYNSVNSSGNKLSFSVHKKRKTEIKVDATYYNPAKNQCDNDPLVTASNDKISLSKLRKKQIRWIACSRDLIKRWGGKLHYGDTVYVESKNKNLCGYWVVKDSMNKRYKKRIDFLCSGKIKGDFSDVVIKF